MKTAEEILKEKCMEHELKYRSFPALIENEDSIVVNSIAAQAIEDYAVQEAIAFTEWATNYHKPHFHINTLYWQPRNQKRIDTYTTEQLYEIFKQDKTK